MSPSVIFGEAKHLSLCLVVLLAAGTVPALGQVSGREGTRPPGGQGADGWNVSVVGHLGGVTSAVAEQGS